jgi:ubiquinone biosynthesis accessory factor UbiJ
VTGRLPPLAGLAERILNRTLALDAEALARLAPLAPDMLAVEIRGTPWTVGLAPHGGGLALVPPEQPRAGVRGDPLALLVWFGRDQEDHVELSGDADWARALAEILRAARPDLEELLSRLFGDVPAHTLGNAVRGALDAAARVRGDLLGTLGEYLQHERGALPSREEMATFEADLAGLRAGLERAEARLRERERGDA